MAEKETEKKKKKNVFLRILGGIFGTILTLLLIIVIWLGVNCFIKTDITDSVPPDYSVHLRTDSLWTSVNPLLDLQAADLLLSDPSLAQAKGAFIDFRKSPLRENKLAGLALSRRLDFMLYDNNSFVAVLDTGFLSGIVKLVPFALNYVHIKNVSENISIVKNSGITHLEYKAGESVFYILIRKNLVLVTGSGEVFADILKGGFSAQYSDVKKDSFGGKLDSPFSVTADSRKILAMAGEGNNYIDAVKNCLPEDRLASVDFGITDHNLKLVVDLPFDVDSLDNSNPVASVLKKESKIPVLVQKLPEMVQYYTVISAGTLQDLKEAFFYAADSSMNLESKWRTAQRLSNTVFHEDLETLFFSWTGNEYAVLGLQNKADPVFVIRIEKENKRKEVFETLFKSIILQNDTSLIIDNVRLPRMELPSFLSGLLESFGIRIPSPYYLVKDGFIYLSQSPENLAAINAAMKNGTRLSQNETWKEISGTASPNTSLSLFYNLERSIPFFLKSKSSVSKVLQLYNVGKADLRVKSNVLEISLMAVECESSGVSGLNGFPADPEGKITSELYQSKIPNSRSVFFTQQNKIVSYDLASRNKIEREADNIKFIVPAAVSGKVDKNTPALWAVTSDGTVYLMDEKLEDKQGFPMMTGFIPSSAGAVSSQGVMFNAKGRRLVTVFPDGKIVTRNVDSFDDLGTKPVFFGGDDVKKDRERVILYERSFMGGLHVLSDNHESEFYPVEGIGFGEPDVIDAGNKGLYAGFVSQSGLLSVMNLSDSSEPVTLDLGGVFYLNVKKCGNSFMALSEEGILYGIPLSEIQKGDKVTSAEEDSVGSSIVKIKIPNLTARSGFLTSFDFDGDGKEEIFVCGEGNVIYGFRENLEMIGCFPVAGYGKPLFVDLDGNKKNDVVCLSLDNKIYGWKLSY